MAGEAARHGAHLVLQLLAWGHDEGVGRVDDRPRPRCLLGLLQAQQALPHRHHHRQRLAIAGLGGQDCVAVWPFLKFSSSAWPRCCTAGPLLPRQPAALPRAGQPPAGAA